jgi:hypothetical protein
MEALMEQLITVSEDYPSKKSKQPLREGTAIKLLHDVLEANPYKYTEREYFHHVHHVLRKRTDLKIDEYKIRRSDLVKKYGYGIHTNAEGKIAMVPCESTKYKMLLEDESIAKVQGYKLSKV